jgi:hypothetical protein
MPYRPRELVVRAREAAALLLAALDHEEMVQRFLDMYAAEHRRPGRADQPGHYREQLETIRREAILSMVMRVEAALPKRLNVSVSVRAAANRKPRKTKKGKRRAAKKPRPKATLQLAIPLLDLFREEFFVALGQALEWKEEDADQFWRDLEVYEKLAPADSRDRSARRVGGGASGPFVDRTAFLLDPSLMDQARQAAGKFQAELDATAERVLREVFSRRRAN